MSDTNPPLIYAKLAAVMNGVGGVGKRDQNQQQRFNFRGIDAVLNAVGPVLRAHNVIVVPNVTSVIHETSTTERGKPMLRVCLEADYVFYAEDGSSITTHVAAEAFDFGDKATAKAMSVALRTALIQALALPTDEPDPDSQSYEVGAAPRRGPDPTVEVKRRIQAAYEARHGSFDLDAMATEFQSVTGVSVAAATQADLAAYLTHLTTETEEQP